VAQVECQLPRVDKLLIYSDIAPIASGFLYEVWRAFPAVTSKQRSIGGISTYDRRRICHSLFSRKKKKLIDVLDRLHFVDWRRFRIRSVYNRFDKIELITNPSGAGHGMPVAQNPIKYPPV
jgi:hypothetical protein